MVGCILSFSPLFQSFKCFSPLYDLNDSRFQTFSNFSFLPQYLHCRKYYFALKDLGTFWKVVVRRRKGKETNIKMSSVETALEGVFRAGMYSRYWLTNKKFLMCRAQKREINYEMKPMLCEKVCFRNFPGVSNR